RHCGMDASQSRCQKIVRGSFHPPELIMKSKAAIAAFAVALALACSVMQAQADIIFSDSFDGAALDPGWSVTTNYADPQFGIQLSSGTLEAHLIAPPGSPSPLVVDANHFFTTGNDTYTFSLEDTAAPCSGCTISARVLVDGVLQNTNEN